MELESGCIDDNFEEIFCKGAETWQQLEGYINPRENYCMSHMMEGLTARPYAVGMI